MFRLFGLFARNELFRLFGLMDPAYRYPFRADSIWANSANLTSRRFFSKIGQIEKIKKIENEECLVWLELSNDNDFEKNYKKLSKFGIFVSFDDFLSKSFNFYPSKHLFFCHIKAEKFWTNFLENSDISDRCLRKAYRKTRISVTSGQGGEGTSG